MVAKNVMQRQGGDAPQKNILTIALEDYFHGPAFSKIINQTRWGRFETRFEENCLAVLQKLEAAESRATFFVNSWVAQTRPDLLREVIRQGHEIALAGQRSVSFRRLSPKTLRDNVRRDRDILEHACQNRVLGFRVTDIFLNPSHLWGLTVLAEEGFRYDSSLSPFLRAFAAEPWRQYIHEIPSPEGSFWEVPLSSQRIAGLMFPVAGGNYFRQLPEWVVKGILARWRTRIDHPLVLYCRLWDFDPLQPRLQTGTFWGNFRHYRNSERMVATLRSLFGQFQFVSIADYLELKSTDVVPALRSEVNVVRDAGVGKTGKTTPISVIVPCFNEEASIPYLSRTLQELTKSLSDEYDVEFILVDDGSQDETWQALTKYFSLRSDTRLIRHAENLGISAAILTGMKHGRDIVCSMDCDCSYDPSELKPMLHLLEDGVDLVTASPYHPAGAVLNVPQWRLLLSRCSSARYRIVTGRKLYTFTSCVRVYRRSAAMAVPLRHPGFLGIAELLSKFALQNKKIVEHPATLEGRLFGQSKMKVIRNIFGHLRLMTQLAGSMIYNNQATDPPALPPRVNSRSAKQSKIVSEVK